MCSDQLCHSLRSTDQTSSEDIIWHFKPGILQNPIIDSSFNNEIKLSRCYNYINKGTIRHFSFMLSKTQKFTTYLAHKKYYPFYYKSLSLEAALPIELIWLGYDSKILNPWNLVHTKKCVQESFSMANLSQIWKLHSLEHQCPLFTSPRWGRPHTFSGNMKRFCCGSPTTSKQHCGLKILPSLCRADNKWLCPNFWETSTKKWELREKLLRKKWFWEWAAVLQTAKSGLFPRHFSGGEAE